jgi:hypothetical protein
LASGDSDDEADEFTLDAAAVVAEEAVERKEALRVKPWLSELDVPGWQELAGDRLGWRKMLKSIKIRTQLVLQVQDRRWIERKMPR